MGNEPRLTTIPVPNQFPQISDRRVNFLQIAAASLDRFGFDLAHERDHVAEIANAGFGQVPFLRPLARPGGDFVNLGLQPAQVSLPGPPQDAAQANEVGK